MKRFGRYTGCELIGIPHDCSCLYCPFARRGRDCRGAPASNLEWQIMTNGKTFEHISKLSGVPVSRLEAYADGRRNINHAHAEIAVRIADAIGCEVCDLLEVVPRSGVRRKTDQ